MNKELYQLNLQFGEAEKSKAIDFFEKHLSDDLLFRRASGKLHNKEQFLKALQDPKLVYHDIKTTIVEIALSDDNNKAVVKAIVCAKIANDGKDIEGHFMNLRFFEQQNSYWQLTSWYNYGL